MVRRAGSKSGVIVKRGAGGKFMGSVKLGGTSFGTQGEKVKMRGSGMSLGALRKQLGGQAAWHQSFGLHKSYAEKPQRASSVTRAIKREAKYQPAESARREGIDRAVAHRAYQRAYKKMPA